ncbi:hypothetical protein CC2G_010076 [Coprinopsis cinerea AmutBmut pab1-1]|nr:hypothetical protein CC2G_010076 [Coprinopsis cinerea AmutBmut pab1-1]
MRWSNGRHDVGETVRVLTLDDTNATQGKKSMVSMPRLCLGHGRVLAVDGFKGGRHFERLWKQKCMERRLLEGRCFEFVKGRKRKTESKNENGKGKRRGKLR